MKPIEDKVCATRYEKVCTQETQKTYDVSVDTSCKDVVQKVCAPAYGIVPARHYKRSTAYAPQCQVRIPESNIL